MLSSVKQAPISEIHQEFGRWGDFVLSKSTSLIGAIELEGRDPDGFLKPNFDAMTFITRDIYQNIPDNIVITQYYAHITDCKVSLKDREHSVCHTLSKRRESFLNGFSLTRSKIIHFFEIKPRENISKLDIFSLVKHFGMSLVDKDSRTIIRNHFSNQGAIVAHAEELDQQHSILDNAIDEVIEKWGLLITCKKLPIEELWGFNRFLSNLEPGLIDSASSEVIPTDNWDIALSDGDRLPVVINSMDCMKFSGVKNQYVRVASITRFGDNQVGSGMWASQPKSPVRLNSNFILMTRFKPLTNFQRSMLFQKSENELERASFSVSDVLMNQKKTAKEKHDLLKPKIRAKMDELALADMVEDRWGLANASVVLFDEDPIRLKKDSLIMKSSLESSGFKFVWESAGLPEAWKNFLVGGKDQGIRDIPFTSSQMGATSLLYKSSEGQRIVPDLNNEEAQYIFQTEDGSPFFFNPFVEGRGVVFGIGPIRSGKSFTKNSLGTNWLKYSGMFRALDVDPGAEPIAACYGKEGGSFTLEANEEGLITKGFNPFFMAKGERDLDFISHIKNLILLMFESNDSEELRKLAPHEQSALDHAIKRTLMLPKEKQRLSNVKNHCPKELARKMERWCEGGMYGHIFDQEKDAIGSMDQLVGTFNLATIRDDKILLPLVMTEIFYRVIKSFEDPKLRLLPKYFDIDEAHAFLKLPYVAEKIVSSVRMWGKWLGAIGLWSQSPSEFLKLEDWPALRSAGSTFFFMSDPSMSKELYQETFNFLTDGECEQIKKLTPKKEAYIIQPDLGVSKKVILNVEPEQYVVSTSKPSEATIFRNYLKEFDFETAQQKTIEDLQLKTAPIKGNQNYA